MKILVMGAGAVGAYYGARLQEAGEHVTFCARGENLRTLRERGLEIKSRAAISRFASRRPIGPPSSRPTI